MITEVGAVKVRGGEVLGEFQTLVNPHQAIPPFIAVLTGITDSMVASAPPIDQVLPQFLEFAQGCVLVAHNAPFDVGFLRHFAERQGRPWPAFEVLDTAKLARRVITKDDAPNCKLSSLATLFGASTTPNHRALSDARATVDVLHGLMGRLGNLGVHTLEELQTFSAQGQHRSAAQAPPGGGAPPRARRLPVQGRPRPGSVRRHLQGPAHAGPHLLHGLRDPLPDGRDGQPRRHRPGHRVRDPPRGRGPGAPADRRAQAPLQPSLPVPRARALDQAHRRALAAAVPGQAGPGRRCRLHRPVQLQARRRAQRRRPARGLSDPPVRRPDAEAAVAGRLRAGRDGSLPVPVQPGRHRRALRRGRRRTSGSPWWAGRTSSWRRSRRG